jgi:drug/metabolite transporter (DMT)-like permease
MKKEENAAKEAFNAPSFSEFLSGKGLVARMIAIIFALVSLLGWGVGDIFTTFASRKLGSYNSTFYGYLFGGLFSALYIPQTTETRNGWHTVWNNSPFIF